MSTPWGAIIKAVQKKADGVKQSFAQGAQSMGQFANNSTVGFTPATNQIQPLQTNQESGGIFSRLAQSGQPQEKSPQQYYGQDINNALGNVTFYDEKSLNPYRYLIGN